MMALRVERAAIPLTGPLPITSADIGPLNHLFSSAFTERYRRDGLSGVRVPPLNPAIWEYAIRGAGAGAMLWRDNLGAIAAFNIAHASGREGWMGPLAVRDDCQGVGQGKAVVREGVAHLRRAGCKTIGLETMPRTMDNIGFYAGIGFVPSHLTVTLTLEAGANSTVRDLLSAQAPGVREDIIAECAALTAALSPGSDYSREIALTQELGLGDTYLLRDGDELKGFALCHAAPLVESRAREELRVLKLVAADVEAFAQMLTPLAALARRSAAARLAIRMQGEFPDAFARVVAAGARVRWTDLRMTLDGYSARRPDQAVVLTNWEI
jgi:GNAT superfamily N-acetyltransferase